jgi:hypothetical protein
MIWLAEKLERRIHLATLRLVSSSGVVRNKVGSRSRSISGTRLLPTLTSRMPVITWILSWSTSLRYFAMAVAEFPSVSSSIS